MKQDLILFSIFLLLTSCFVLIAHDAMKLKPQPVDKPKLINVLRVIDQALEKDDGAIDFNEISSRDDWGKFCLVLPYVDPEIELKEFISDVGSIEEIFHSVNDESFGLGVLFVKDKTIIDHMHMPRTAIPDSSDIGKNIKAILPMARNGTIGVSRLTPSSSQSGVQARATCYGREYTIKIDENWKYTLVKSKDRND